MKTTPKALKYASILILVFVFLSEYFQNTSASSDIDHTELQITQEAASEEVAQDFDRISAPKIFIARTTPQKLINPDYFLARSAKNYLAELRQYCFKNIYLITVTSLAP